MIFGWMEEVERAGARRRKSGERMTRKMTKRGMKKGQQGRGREGRRECKGGGIVDGERGGE